MRRLYGMRSDLSVLSWRGSGIVIILNVAVELYSKFNGRFWFFSALRDFTFKRSDFVEFVI